MKDINTFRESLRAVLSNKRGAQAALVKATGVPQYAVSRFLSGKDMPGRYLLPVVAYLQHEGKDNVEV